MGKRKRKFIVIGGGLAGLAAAMKLCEFKAEVVLVSYQAVKRSHSVCAQGGINAAIDTKGEGDSPEIHFYDTVKGGDFLAHLNPESREVLKGCKVEASLADAVPGTRVQFERTGYFVLDRDSKPGALVFNRTIALRDSWAKIAKKQAKN